jgi:hypothetical protein
MVKEIKILTKSVKACRYDAISSGVGGGFSVQFSCQHLCLVWGLKEGSLTRAAACCCPGAVMMNSSS